MSPPDDAGPLPSQLGRYEILEELGRGGMGVVYKAKDPRIGRMVVIKVVKLESFIADEKEEHLRRRFRREAEAAGRLSHPSIVTVLDVGWDEQTRSEFIAMEFVPGATLQHIVATGVQMKVEQVLADLGQIADALDYAHSQGIVHRDVKPANILVRSDGILKIADFGIARVDTSNLTRTGQILGSPSYMSPEQVKGDPVDGRSDQFSLAVVAYRLLTGKLPFSGDQASTVYYKVAHADPVPPAELRADLPRAVSEALLKALSKEPGQRYASCGEMVLALRSAWDGAATTRPVKDALPPTPPPSLPTPPSIDAGSLTYRDAPSARSEPPPSRRSSAGLWLGVATVMALLLGLGLAAVVATLWPDAVRPKTVALGPGVEPTPPLGTPTSVPASTPPPSTAEPTPTVSPAPPTPTTTPSPSPSPRAEPSREPDPDPDPVLDPVLDPSPTPEPPAAPPEPAVEPTPEVDPGVDPPLEPAEEPAGDPAPPSPRPTPTPTPDPIRTSDAELVRLHVEVGRHAFDQGNLEEARREFAEALRLDPDNQTARNYATMVESELARRSDPESAQAPPVVVMVPRVGAPVDPSGPTDGALVVALADHLDSGTLTVLIGGKPAIAAPFQPDSRDLGEVNLPGIAESIRRTTRNFPLGITAGTHEVTVRVTLPARSIDVTGAGLIEVGKGQICTLDVGVGGGQLMMRRRCRQAS